MLLYYFFLLSIVVLIIVRVSRSYFFYRKNIPFELYLEALKNENDGQFEAAVINYETVLNKFKKTRFHNGLRNKITARLKVLHTVLEYKNNLRFTR